MEILFGLQVAMWLACIFLILLLVKKVKCMTQATDRLTATVADQKTVLESAVALITGFPALVGEAVRKALEAEDIEDEAVEQAVNTAASDMEANTQPLKDALVANTPQA